MGYETHGLGAPRVEGGCEGEGGEDARPRAKAGASGVHGIPATMAESCHHVSLVHWLRP